MAVRGKKCQDIKQASWISLSFGSTQESDEDCCSPAEKRAKMESEKISNSITSFDSVSNDNFVKSGFSSTRGQVWTDIYAPKKLDNVVVHKKKVTEVCDYLKSVFSHGNRKRILLLTGPTGCGKTCTLTAVCNFLNINVVEWVTPIDNSLFVNYDYDVCPFDNSFKHIGQSNRSCVQMFNEFIFQAAKYSSLLSSGFASINRKIIMIKDLPNVFLANPEIFHETMKKYYDIDHNVLINHNISPLVFIVSDVNIIRDLFPDDLKSDLNVTSISFNPMTSVNIVKVLDRILSLEINRPCFKSKRPSKDVLVNIADSSDGDLRSAILKLQFSLSSCYNKTSFDFKVPITLNSRPERIKIIKSSSKLKTSKRKICEIDKDKTVDFFNSVGRVLYPKIEFLNSDDKVNSGGYRFVHSPSAIADIYLAQPNKFINILHENYLERFTYIKDVCHAANSLSLSDLLLSLNYESKEIMVTYSLNMAARSLMVSNTKPAPNTFRPMSKSKIWATEIKRKENQDLVRQIFPDFHYEKDVLLDVIPYLTRLNINFNLTKTENQIISKIAKYNQ